MDAKAQNSPRTFGISSPIQHILVSATHLLSREYRLFVRLIVGGGGAHKNYSKFGFGFACRWIGLHVGDAMKIRFLLAPVAIALVLSGCGQKAAAPAAPASAAVPAAGAGPRLVEITANDTMKYNVTTLEAKAGEQLKVVLTNTGTMPKEVMGHNWILLKAGSDATAFSTAAMAAKDTNYVPAALKDQVIAAIDLIGPRKSGEVVFTVPGPGEYPFLCSFPAHFAVGMKGLLIVK